MPRGANLYMSAETEQLIEMVREHPCLYDPRLPTYRDCTLWSHLLEVVIVVVVVFVVGM